MPGSAQAVGEHEEWGNWAYRAFVVVGLLELAALALRSRGRAKPALVASALVGLGGLFVLYEAGEHGGKLVYSYAGGVGIRTGAPEDVGRLLLAGLYHQAQLDRKAQRPEDAAALIELAARRFPADPGVQLAAGESLLLDRKDAAAAVTALERTSVPRRRPPAAHAARLVAGGRVREPGEQAGRARRARAARSRSSRRTNGSRSGSSSSAAAVSRSVAVSRRARRPARDRD